MCAVWKEQQPQVPAEQCLSVSLVPILGVQVGCHLFRPPFWCRRPVCELHAIPLGGPHSIKGKGPVFPLLDLGRKIQNSDMWRFLLGKVLCAFHFSVDPQAHFCMNEAPSVRIPSVFWVEQCGSSSMSYHVTCGGAKMILSPQLGLCVEDAHPAPCSHGASGWHGISAQLVVWGQASRAGDGEIVLSIFPHFTLAF